VWGRKPSPGDPRVSGGWGYSSGKGTDGGDPSKERKKIFNFLQEGVPGKNHGLIWGKKKSTRKKNSPSKGGTLYLEEWSRGGADSNKWVIWCCQEKELRSPQPAINSRGRDTRGKLLRGNSLISKESAKKKATRQERCKRGGVGTRDGPNF